MMRYLSAMPRQQPKSGRVIVHNFVHAQYADQGPGSHGFRVWTQERDEEPKISRCNCGWSGLVHYRGPDAFGYGKPPSVAARHGANKNETRHTHHGALAVTRIPRRTGHTTRNCSATAPRQRSSIESPWATCTTSGRSPNDFTARKFGRGALA